MEIFDLEKAIGKGYKDGWWNRCRVRYRCFKGARNTKKSYNLIGYEVLDKIFRDKRRNVLIIRDTYSSNRLTTFSTLEKIIYEPVLGNSEISWANDFQIRKNDMTIIYKPTGQMIFFRGMDDPQKIQGLRTPKGYLTDVYVEEAFQLKDEESWRKVDGTIRGKLPEGLFFQITFLLNAWESKHWINDKFFKGRLDDDYAYLSTHDYQDYRDDEFIGDYGKGLYLHTSTYKINEFRAEYYDELMMNMKDKAIERFKVEGLGMWGLTTSAVYPEFNEHLIKPHQILNNQEYASYSIGIDTGLSNGEGKVLKGEDVKIRSATAMILTGITSDYGKLCYINEYFWSNEQAQIKKTEPQLMEEIINKIIEWSKMYLTNYSLMKGVTLVYVDSADIGFRQGLELKAREKGLWNIRFISSTKIKIQDRVDFVRLLMSMGDTEYSDLCKNLIRETKNAVKGAKGECREDIDDHCLTSSEYAWIPLRDRIRLWKHFKPR